MAELMRHEIIEQWRNQICDLPNEKLNLIKRIIDKWDKWDKWDKTTPNANIQKLEQVFFALVSIKTHVMSKFKPHLNHIYANKKTQFFLER